MTKIICGNLKCKYWNINNKCNCKNIVLRFSNIGTIWEGRKDILECEQFEESEDYKIISKIAEKIFFEEDGKNNKK